MNNVRQKLILFAAGLLLSGFFVFTGIRWANFSSFRKIAQPNLSSSEVSAPINLAGNSEVKFKAAAPQSVQANLIAKFRNDSARSKFLGDSSKDSNIAAVNPLFPGSSAPEFVNVFRVKTSYTLNSFKKQYAAVLDYAQPENQVQAGFVNINDPGFSNNVTDINRQWGLLKAKFPDAWDKAKGSGQVVVAIIDTGIDGSHEDLSSGQVGPGFNFLNNTFIQLGADSDDNGHGTLVAGVVGATVNNFRGIAGTNWNVTLMPLKALSAGGSGNSGDIASAIVWAADHGANVLNMSLGGIGFGNDTTLSNAIAYAYKKNVVIVAAAGNDVATTGGNLDQEPVFPVCDDNGQNMIIGVAATDVNDVKANFSNFGKACVDVSAPGQHILSTISVDPAKGQSIPNSYAFASGTSLAAPFVSGEAALIKSLFPNASNTDIRDRIIQTADPIDVLNNGQCAKASCSGMLGSGRINAAAALNQTLSSAVTITEGSLVQAENLNGIVYLISGGQKQPISPFVLSQRFPGVIPQIVPSASLEIYPTGPYALPKEGTLVKSGGSTIIYMISGGFKRPITYQIFLQRNIQSQQINVVTDTELNSWVTGTFLPPTDGTLVKSTSGPTVYWVIDGQLHPINHQFWIDRGLNIFPIIIISSDDLKSFALGNPFIR